MGLPAFWQVVEEARLHSVGLPPELELLEFFNELGKDEEVTDLLLAMLQNKSVVARNLERMVVVEGNDKVLGEVKTICKEQGLQLDIIGELDEDESDEDLDGVTDSEEDEDEEEDESD